MAPNPLFAPIAKHRVTESTPVREKDELDIERCAALHNTLTLYSWVCSGRPIPSMKKQSWWSRYGSQPLEAIVQPEVRKYLSKIFDVEVPGHQSIFYHLTGLARPQQMFQLGDVLEDQEHDVSAGDRGEKYRFIVLYAASRALVSHPAGLVYDQQKHRAILMPTYHHIFDLYTADLPWQRLEVILSAYIDMIDAEKATAIPESWHPDTLASAAAAEAAIARGDTHMTVRPSTKPWILQPYTLSDLNNCLDAWKRLIKAIEEKADIKRDAEANVAPLCTRSALDVAGIPKGFAYDLLLHAHSSEIWFVAPGIRLPKVEEFIHQPFRHILEEYPDETKEMKMPFLFMRCPGTVSAKEAKFRYPFSTVDSVPCGLYLDAFPNAQNPFEDACRFVLPIRLGSNRYARTSDFKPIRRSYCDLYQVDINPFVMRHGPKLVGVLENWAENVENGHWEVNGKGVEGGVGVWRKADTREDWWRYQGGVRHLYL
ncbi:hypothetical protein LTR78_006822 [Recurvomyces mirabilis]|uniref:Uncharacterized protein n=1 Tax=Recurvomyces mirabilis TaxID=574656 RepID=A0AAE0WKA6_9PEZI|nr:hypothetical protein LTR78_006822 [Recurvomyces mirabilis]KAK5153188.1 hypothetical protein LTS14_007833 [Recurvomyces mirabilis]